MSLAHVALGIAYGDAQHGVHEEGGNNAGVWIRKYLSDLDPPVTSAVPWCAAAAQYWTDMAAQLVGVPNPLDAVKLEAYVQSYADWAQANAKVVPLTDGRSGDLILFNFGGQRFDHIGIVARAVNATTLVTCEGNTSAGVGETDAEKQREGDGVYVKTRIVTRQPVLIVRWA